MRCRYILRRDPEDFWILKLHTEDWLAKQNTNRTDVSTDWLTSTYEIGNMPILSASMPSAQFSSTLRITVRTSSWRNNERYSTSSQEARRLIFFSIWDSSRKSTWVKVPWRVFSLWMEEADELNGNYPSAWHPPSDQTAVNYQPLHRGADGWICLDPQIATSNPTQAPWTPGPDKFSGSFHFFSDNTPNTHLSAHPTVFLYQKNRTFCSKSQSILSIQ